MAILFSTALLLVCIVATLAKQVASADIFSPSWATTKKLIAVRFPSAKQISTTDFAAWLIDVKRVDKPFVIDVREADECAVSQLAGSTHVGNLSEAKTALKGRAVAAAVVVYCSVGYRSSALAVQLQEAGYTNVQNLDGSIFQWANEGRLVFKGNLQVTKVHPYNATWGDLLDKKYWSHQP